MLSLDFMLPFMYNCDILLCQIVYSSSDNSEHVTDVFSFASSILSRII